MNEFARIAMSIFFAVVLSFSAMTILGAFLSEGFQLLFGLPLSFYIGWKSRTLVDLLW